MDVSETDFLLGLLGEGHVAYDDQRATMVGDDPALVDMVEKALEMLMKDGNKEGFFLMMESGRIDHAHHATQANRALSETVAFDEAIEKILEVIGVNFMLDVSIQ